MSASTDNYQSEIDFLQKVDRIISGDVKIRLREISDKSGSNLAYANLKKRSINVNFKVVNDRYAVGDKMLFIALCKGFNYHELAHLLFCKHHRLTIPHNDVIMSILNVLQDGRDETLMSRVFPSTRLHFENCFMRVIHADKEKMNSTMFLATHSRRLIITSDEVKQYWEVVFRKAFGDETTDEVKVLIDLYIVTSSPRKQLDIAERIFALLHANAKNNRQAMDNIEGFNSSSRNTLKALADALETLSKLSPEEKRELERLAKQIMKEQKKTGGGSKLSDEIKKEIDNNEKQNDLLNQKQKELDEARGEHTKLIREYSDGDKEIRDMQKQRTTETDAKKKTELEKKILEKNKELEKISEKSRQSIDKANEKIKEINEVEAKISHDEIDKQAQSKAQALVESLQDEILDDLETIYKNESAGYGAGQDDTPDFDDERNNAPLVIEARHNINSRKLQDVIRTIRNSQRKGFVEGQASGKVNMQNAMNIPKTGNLNVFRKFLPDKRLQTRIGVIIILDSSGSMSDEKFNRALQSTWIIQDAMTKTGNPTLIMEFGRTTRIVKPFKGKGVFKRHLLQGNTFIVPPLLEAKKQIKLSSKVEHIEHWLVCMITDGSWSDGEKAEEIIIELNRKDVETMFVFIPENEGQKVEQHHCKHTATILDVDELSTLLRDSIKKMQMNIESKIKRKGV